VALFLGAYALFMLASADTIGKRLPADYAGDSMLARVRVADFPKATGDSIVMLIEPAGDSRIPARVRVSWFDPPHVPAIGEIWELELRLRRPRGTSNPGVFDYESWLFREKIHATGYVVGGKRNRLLWSGTSSALDRFRQRFAARALAAAESTETAGVLAAVGVGLRHQISRDQWDRFAVSGTSHLMAISGLHVGLAALASSLLVFVLLGVLPGRRNACVAAIIAGLVFAMTYAAISGFGVPARRATIMLAVAALAVSRRRQVDPVAAVALAAVLVYIFDPVATMRPGFDLSFAAVVLLLWLAKRRRGTSLIPRWLDTPRQLLTMQVFLLFGLVPLTALLFQRFAVVATPVNLVAVPLFSVVTVPLTLAALAVGDLSEGLASHLLVIAAHSIDALDRFIEFMVNLPMADTRLAAFGGAGVLLLCLPLAWVALPPGWPGRHLAILGIVAIVTWRPAAPPAGCFDAWILDVGQGLAVAVQTHEGVMVFDTGMAWRGGGSVAEQSIVPFLRSRGIRHVNQLVISHADLDHSGGVAVIRREIGVGNVLAGEHSDLIASSRCLAGQHWVSAGVRFEVLHPARLSLAEGNAASCVVRVSVGSYGMLLTGDIEARSESLLIRNGAPLASDIVVVPHHGSLTSSTVPFTDSVRPAYAVISAGFGNRWGFPKPRVVERWRAVGATVLNTAASGAIHFRVCSQRGVVAVSQERQLRHRFWHARH
jgi:competence protein ComEC